MIPQDLVCTEGKDNSPPDCFPSLDKLGGLKKVGILTSVEAATMIY